MAGEELEELEAVEDAITPPLELELPVTDTETKVHVVDSVSDEDGAHVIVCADAGVAVKTAGANARPPTATAEPASVTIRDRKLIRTLPLQAHGTFAAVIKMILAYPQN